VTRGGEGELQRQGGFAEARPGRQDDEVGGLPATGQAIEVAEAGVEAAERLGRGVLRRVDGLRDELAEAGERAAGLGVGDVQQALVRLRQDGRQLLLECPRIASTDLNDLTCKPPLVVGV